MYSRGVRERKSIDAPKMPIERQHGSIQFLGEVLRSSLVVSCLISRDFLDMVPKVSGEEVEVRLEA